jgi:hypothetical protein
MNHSNYTKEEIVSRGEVLYERQFYSIIETEENLGKIVMIDIESEDYVIANTGLEASQQIRGRRPEGVFCALRIGYTAVETIGGVLSHPAERQVCPRCHSKDRLQ